MMLMLNLSIGSSPIATHQTHYLGPFGQRADIALPSHCQPVAGFFISGSGNHHRHAYLLNRPEGLIPYYKQHPVLSEVIWLNVCKIKKALPECHG